MGGNKSETVRKTPVVSPPKVKEINVSKILTTCLVRIAEVMDVLEVIEH